jgi:hypothetical protein
MLLNKADFTERSNRFRKNANTRPKREEVVDRWLDYDLVALAMFVLGIAAVEFLALTL